MPCSILIVNRKPELVEQIKTVLRPRGYPISAACDSGTQALRSVFAHPVDIAVTGFLLSDMSGLEFADALLEKSETSVLMITPQAQLEYVKEQSAGRDIVALPRPVTAQALVSALEMMEHYRGRVRKANDEAKKARSDLERRALADRAKAALMAQTGMTEAEAWRTLQKRSMDTGSPLREVALDVLAQYEVKTQI